MHDRVLKEIEIVRLKYRNLQYGEKLDWMLITAYPLPLGLYNKAQTKLLFLIPPGYPNTGPDNCFVEADVRLSNGGMPPSLNLGSQSSSGTAPIPGDWAWFSWHPQVWSPAVNIEDGDNLMTFLRGVSLCLRGEGTT